MVQGDTSMSTKTEPGKYDCYAKLAQDEPYFVLRAKDPHAPALVELWAALREAEFGPSMKFLEARACAAEMRQWFKEHACQPLGERSH
jgi:hypothetical protein